MSVRRHLHLLVCSSVLVAGLTAGAAGARATLRTPSAHTAIIGGQPAATGTWPSLAFIADIGADTAGLCTGTVVAANLVLTAAHCAENLTDEVDPVSGFRVVTGSVDWTDQAARQVSAVSRSIIYPGFEPITDDGDAALLVLSTPTTMPAITLPSLPDTSLLTPGDPVGIAGWGVAAVGGSPPDVLNAGVTVLQSATYCEGDAQGTGFSFDPVDQLCAIDAADATGICNGDSGGPLVASVSGEPVEIGLAIRGPEDCSPDFPDTFTRTDAILPWIQNEIADVTPSTTSTSTTSTTTTASTTTSTSTTSSAKTYSPATMATAKAYVHSTLRTWFGGVPGAKQHFVERCRYVNPRRSILCSVSWSNARYSFAGVLTIDNTPPTDPNYDTQASVTRVRKHCRPVSSTKCETTFRSSS